MSVSVSVSEEGGEGGEGARARGFVGGVRMGRPVRGSRDIFGTGLDVRARIRRGWFSRLVCVAGGMD